MTPSNKKRPRFPLLFLKFLFSHGPLALLLPLSKPFLKVSTEYLISFSVKSSSLLDFWSKVSADPNIQESQHFFFQKKKKVKPLSMGECTGQKSKVLSKLSYQALSPGFVPSTNLMTRTMTAIHFLSSLSFHLPPCFLQAFNKVGSQQTLVSRQESPGS